jgi:pilus assembly protein FimV
MMLVALYRANPEAFVGKNMNRLKSGQILTVPDSDAIKGTGEGEARGVVVAHAADFNAYRNKLAGQVAPPRRQKTPEAARAPAARSPPRSRNARPPPTKRRTSSSCPRPPRHRLRRKSAGATVEDKIAKEKALADAAARVKELEKNVGDLEKI